MVSLTTGNGSHIFEQVSEMATSATWCVSKIDVTYVNKLSVADKRKVLRKTEDIGDPYAYALRTLTQEDLPPVRSTFLTTWC